MEDLKPCPFCGGKTIEIEFAPVSCEYYPYYCYCSYCGGSGGRRKTIEKAVKAWNRREDNVGRHKNTDACEV